MSAIRGLGAYIPADSVVHRLDAVSKLGVLAAFTTGLFLVGGFAGLGAFALALVAGLALARVPFSAAVRGVKALTVLLTLTVALNALAWRPAAVALVRLGPLAVDGAGLQRGAYFALRVVVLVVATTLLTLTTSPVEIAGGIERVLRPLRYLGVPVAELAMTLTIALRFVPTTAEEAERIITAQTARGARFDSGGPIARARAYVPVLVPLFFNLFRRADELATAMEARCYRGAEGRTRLNESRMGARDWAVLLVLGGVLVVAGVVL